MALELPVIARQAWLGNLANQQAFGREMTTILRDAANYAEAIVLRNGELTIGGQVRQMQLQQTLIQLRVGIMDAYGKMTPAIQAGIERATAAGADGLRAIDAFLAAAAAPGLRDSFIANSDSAIENLRSRLLNEIDLSPQVYKTQALSQGWVDRAVNRGIATGASARDIATSVKSLIRPDTPGGVSYASMRLGRTELSNAFRTTSDRMAQAAPWVIGERWELSGSHSREDECDDYADADTEGLGGGVYSPGNIPDTHPDCMCYTTDVVIGEEAFLNNLVAGEYDGWTAE